MAHSRANCYRPVDFMTNSFFKFGKNSYDHIVDDPENFLLTQDDLFDAEGGYLGLALQLATMGGAFAALFTFRPSVYKYLMKGHMNFGEWAMLAGTGFLSYRLGYGLGYTLLGNSEKISNHYAAYYLQKNINRFDGRISLMKAPSQF